MKRLICIFLLALLSLASCAREREYTDAIACVPLASSLCELCPVEDGYSQFKDDEIRFLFDNSTSYDDYAVFYSNDSNDINEIGIFHCPDEKSAEEMLLLTREYLNTLQETQVNFISSYAPYEIPKLEGAEVKRYGNYVVYTILDSDGRRVVYSTVEKELSK